MHGLTKFPSLVVHITYAFACLVVVTYKFLHTDNLQVENVDENEWWNRIRQLREGTQQELVVKQRNFGRDGQNILADMAHRQGLYL
jgi:hypothetical protein